MVFKEGKYGVRSGNTLKASDSAFLRRYRRQSHLVRQVIPAQNQDIFDDYDTLVGSESVKEDNVKYSLNKKGRWNLPELLKHDILHGDHDGEDVGIQLLERHNVNKKANCIGVYSTMGTLKEVTAKKSKSKRRRTGYLHPESVLNAHTGTPSLKRKNNKREHNRSTIKTEKITQCQSTQIRYDVCYPSSKTSSITHNPKYVGYDTSKTFPETYKSGQRYRRNNGHTIQESLECMDSDSCSDDDEDVYDDSEAAFEYGKGNSILLEEFIKPMLLGSELNVPTEQTTVIQKTPVFEPVPVIISVEQTAPQDLFQRFGKNYIECGCFPRKFVIDISEMCKNTMYSNEKKSPKSNIVLIFVHDAENEINNMKEHVYKVTLNTVVKDTIRNMKIETLFDYMEIDIEDIITNTLFFIETLPRGTIVGEETVRKITHQVKPTTLEQILNWETQSYFPSDFVIFQDFIRNKNNIDNQSVVTKPEAHTTESTLTLNSLCTVSSQDKICNICFNTLGTTEPATCLKSCLHWFCDNCWQEFLETSVLLGKVKLVCPEFKCKNEIDAGTALSLMTMRNFTKHARYHHGNEVERQEISRWCPNVQCGRVLRANSVAVVTGQCKCGENLCFRCSDRAHWPAPCEATEDYRRGLREKGDTRAPTTYSTIKVRGKRCPHCKKFVTKDGGCPAMSCTCGEMFCWGCGKPYSYDDNNTHNFCYQVGYNDNYRTINKIINPAESFARQFIESDKWYADELRYLVKQPAEVKKMKCNVTNIGKALNYFIKISERKGKAITLEFVCQNACYRKEEDKVFAYLKDTIRLHVEVDHLLEYTGVLLQSHTLAPADRPFLERIGFHLTECTEGMFTHLKDQDIKVTRAWLNGLTELRSDTVKGIEKLVQHVNTCSAIQ